VVAYVGLDLEVKQSGKWKGQAKLSKRGSGRLRRMLYLAAVRSIRLKGSAFGAYYHRLIARGMKGCDALPGGDAQVAHCRFSFATHPGDV